jgi:hypothetical protein
MVSERSYWLILIAGLGLFITVDLFWVFPFLEENLLGFGVDLLVNAFFTIFTIVFLTWGISIREERRWKIVGSKVQERIDYHLHKIFDDLCTYFVEPIPQAFDEISKTPSISADMVNMVKGEKTHMVLLAEYYAAQESIKLGGFAKAFLEKPDRTVATYLMENFKRERDFLEHVVSEYPDFLPPDFTFSVMEIEDYLDDVVDAIWLVSMSRPSKDRDFGAKLGPAVHGIIKEINMLDKKGLCK